MTLASREKERFFEVDLLRFLAAFVVVLFHYSFNGFHRGSSPLAFPALEPVTKYGYLGVEFFFMISGFVISLSAAGRSARQFLISRIVRLYPAFWLGCTLTFLVTYFVASTFKQPTLGQFLVNLTMLQDFVGVRSIDGVYWTLTYELKFYFLIFLLLVINRFQWLEPLCVAWLVYSAMIYFGLKIKYVGVLLFPDYGVYFVAGVLFFLVRQRGPSLRHGLLLLLTYALSLAIALQDASLRQNDLGVTHSPLVIGLIITAFYGVFLLVALRKFSWFQASWATELGAVTYPLYLFHAYIGYVIFQQAAPYLNKYLLLASLIALFCAFAYLTSIYVEKPLSKALNRWLKRLLLRPPVPQTPAPPTLVS
ncbi:acyltransferase family protein [Hymenobacter sp. B81]|uniref:acyltransferase family protein n=1 Tax=Hymenobacter sp. B81 TaxID=3344878 RepID=UPI0037DC8832